MQSQKIQTNEAKATELVSGLKENAKGLDFKLSKPSYSESIAVNDLKDSMESLVTVLEKFEVSAENDTDNLLKIHQTIEEMDGKLAKGG